MPGSYDPRTALIVVDVQNDFADPGGSLYVQDGDAVVHEVNAEVEAALEAGAPVVYTQDWHPPTTPHFDTEGGDWPVHCVRETWGAQLHPALRVEGPVVRKGTGGEDGYSGFSVRDPETGDTTATDLHALLQEQGAERVVVVGLAQDVCVKATALDAVSLGYNTQVPTHATRAVEVQPGDGGRALEELAAAGVELV